MLARKGRRFVVNTETSKVGGRFRAIFAALRRKYCELPGYLKHFGRKKGKLFRFAHFSRFGHYALQQIETTQFSSSSTLEILHPRDPFFTILNFAPGYKIVALSSLPDLLNKIRFRLPLCHWCHTP